MLNLKNLIKLTKKRKRVGRGGSRGGTSGRGNKGQKARSGGSVPARFEGGQMPLSRRLPKRGFNNTKFKKEYEIVSTERLDNYFKDGDSVTREILLNKGIIKGKRNALVKILGNYKLSKKLNVIADAYSVSAKNLIIDIGGKADLTGRAEL